MNTGRVVRVLLACAAFGIVAAPHAQEATERFIPIGQSPGLSTHYTYIGELSAYDRDRRVCHVQGPAGSRDVRLVDQTRIWLDRSKLGRTNVVGSPDDLVAGRRIEIKYVDPEDRSVADWIKIEVAD